VDERFPTESICFFSSDKVKSLLFYMSLPDLILNPEFMKAVYGEKCFYENECVYYELECDKGEPNTFCPGRLPQFSGIAHEALDIIMAGNCPIDYLYDNLEGK
jgi:hypothetical protein